MTEDGASVQGENGPITVLESEGEVRVDRDGTIWNGEIRAGRLSIVEFADPSRLQHDRGTRLIAPGQDPTAVEAPNVQSGTLEQSNVSMAERMAQLTTVSRGFEAMQKAMSLLINDVDGRAIEQLGRR